MTSQNSPSPRPAPQQIADAVARLKAGRLVAFPTETVYGLGADVLNARAVEAVFAAKGRPASNPLIVHVTDAQMAARVAEWTPEAGVLAERFWPGALTLVLQKRSAVPDAATAGGTTVAVRAPDHPLALALISTFGGPLVGPSANRSGAVSPTLAEHVSSAWSQDEVMVLDGGPCVTGLESTVVDLTATDPVVLRRGVIGEAAISEVLGRDVRVSDAHPSSHAARSPGLVGPHYQPGAPVRLYETLDDLGAALKAARGPAAVLGPPGVPVAVDPPHHAIPMPAAAGAYGASLYAALREADALAPTLILAWSPPPAGGLDDADDAVWRAIADRLRRASA